MNTKLTTLCFITITLFLLVQIEAYQTQLKNSRAQRALISPPLSAAEGSSSTVSSLLDRIRGIDQRSAKPELAETNDTNDNDEETEDDGEDDNGEEDEEAEDNLIAAQLQAAKKPETQAWTDMFGNQLKIDQNRTTLVLQNKARDFGLLAIKALILGPLIGLTIKAALIRGLLWAIGAYLLHLFFPTLLSTLGLGTGLVGFARQMQPDIAQLVLPHLANFTMCAIDRSQGVTN